jgi:hypothetical protein
MTVVNDLATFAQVDLPGARFPSDAMGPSQIFGLPPGLPGSRMTHRPSMIAGLGDEEAEAAMMEPGIEKALPNLAFGTAAGGAAILMLAGLAKRNPAVMNIGMGALGIGLGVIGAMKLIRGAKDLGVA